MVDDAVHQRAFGNLESELRVEIDIFWTVSFEVADRAGGIEGAAERLHQQPADAVPANLRDDADRAEMDVRLVRIMLRPDREPLGDANGGLDAETPHHRRGDAEL